MVDVYEGGKKLFHDYINELVDLGWKKEQMLPNVFIMTDTVGKTAFVTCEYDKPFQNKEHYFITAKIETKDNDTYMIHLGVVNEEGAIPA